MRSLRRNCFGEKPCELELLSDVSEALGNAPGVNYEDQDINIAIPVFSIHGNHDDPSGDGHYCSLDLLQVSGLLNYFGRTPESDRIDVKPILLQKGQTKLALYGMSNVRDERLFRTFRDGNVKFYKPEQQPNDWFNLMAVHQNHHAHGETNYLPENFLPDFLDLVVWGHEHECLIDPQTNPETNFAVMQPGSSVATSLVPGEAVPKHVAILSISGKEFTVEKHRLKTVRPFITQEIILAKDSRFKHMATMNDNRSKITNELKKVVEDLIQEARDDWVKAQGDDVPDEKDIPLPLVRLKVEFTAYNGGKFDCENPQRFSNRFQGQVANINDIVQFYMKKAKGRSDNTDVDKPSVAAMESMNEEAVKVEALVREYLNAQSLKILPGVQFVDAVSQFVDQKDIHAMESFIGDSLAAQFKEIMGLEIEEEDLDPAMEASRLRREALFSQGKIKNMIKNAKLKPQPPNWDSDDDGPWSNQPGAYEYTLSGDEAAEEEAPPKKKRGKAAAKDEEKSDDEASIVSAPAKKAPAKRAPAKKSAATAPAKAKAPAKAPAKKAPTKTAVKSKNKGFVVPSDDEDEDDDVMMLDEAPAPKVMPKRAAAARGGRTTQSQLNFGKSQSQVKTQTARELSDDVIELDSDDDEDAFAPAASSSRSRRK